jgi:hypothetical protein
MKKSQRYFTLLLFIIAASCNRGSKEVTVLSPDKKIQFKISTENGIPYYEIYSDKIKLFKKADFSFTFKDLPPFDDSLSITDVENKYIDETWIPVAGTSDSVRNNYNETSITFKEKNKLSRKLIFVVRAYNDGVAFRYIFPENGKYDSLFITAENTHFSFAADDSAWWIPSNEFAYESLYRNSPLSEIADANTPLTIETSSGLFLSIHEASLLDYSEMTLKRTTNDSLTFVSSLWPEPDGVCARVKLPFKTPWRMLMICRKPGDLIESHLLQNLNEPCQIKDVSWIKPMKFIGIWWGMHIGKYTWYNGPDHGATTERMKKYIDFAAAHNIEGVIAEGWNKGWDTWASGVKPVQDFSEAYPDFDLQEVVRYAKEKNIEFISHHETGGNIPEYEEQMDEAFALCQKLGIKYLKTGYAGPIIPEGYHHHGQYMVRHFQKVVETAAKYHISLDVHESIKPTGLDRTWPNLLTQEGARGNEWNATYKATPPYHQTILPFTRFLAGPYDYTPGIFHIIHSPDKNKRLYCTLSNQIALFVVFYSPMMMVSDMIENYENKPAFTFIEKVPCSWNETRVIDASLGDYVTVARRKNNNWFIGSVVDENAYLIKIPMSFLKKETIYVATIYGDSITTDWEKNPEAIEIGRFLVTREDTIYAAISKAGGHSVILAPADNKEISSLPYITAYNKSSGEKIKVFQKLKTYGNMLVEHLARNKVVVLKNTFSKLYPASGNNALTDGTRGGLNYSSGNWQGFEGTNLEATIDLQKEINIKKIAAGFLCSVNDWIFYPEKVEFFTSIDGKDYKKAGEQVFSTTKFTAMKNLIEIKDFSEIISPIIVRYLKVKAFSIGNCPDWHQGKGKKAWMFCDEIMVE